MEVQQHYGGEVEIIGIPGLSSDIGSMRDFAEATGTEGITHLVDVDGELWARFGVTSQRTYVFVNDDGSQRRSGYGSLPQDVEELLAM
ncbi:MAG: hypothetical protein QNJ12_09440 [Ilumatobacter sp.]|uniref:peroxiredoxin family protein n=1 Tax=Ilumatobacter sp. TaxID=1967498 RepID=UPI0026016736|nr:hypothetical protein [Ilumatobacter sp.]MDJ0769006.1 hypothetical protein [Ilumatobacter sp.]